MKWRHLYQGHLSNVLAGKHEQLQPAMVAMALMVGTLMLCSAVGETAIICVTASMRCSSCRCSWIGGSPSPGNGIPAASILS